MEPLLKSVLDTNYKDKGDRTFMKDTVTRSLQDLKGTIPNASDSLTEAQKDAIVIKIGGPKTVKQLISAKKELPIARIPFLFSTLDTQCVVEVLAHDFTQAILRAENKQS